MKIKFGILILVLIGLLALTGCKSDAGVTETAIPDMPTSYPAPAVNLPLVTSSEGYPAPSGAPVRENASRVQVELLSLTPSQQNPNLVILHVRVNSLGMVEGFEPYDPEMAGKEIDILLPAEDVAGFAVGSVFNLTVSYRGDEWGGGYYGSDIASEN